MFCRTYSNAVFQTPPIIFLPNLPISNLLPAPHNSYTHVHLVPSPQSTPLFYCTSATCTILTLADRYRCNYWCHQHTSHHSYSYSQCSLHHWSDSWYQRNQGGTCMCRSWHTGYRWHHCGMDQKHIHPHLSHSACHQIHPHKGMCSHQSHQDMFHHSDTELKSRLRYFTCDGACSCSPTMWQQRTRTVLTWSAVICVDNTVSALIALCADTVIWAVCIATCRTIATRRRHDTFIYVLVTKAARVAQTTSAGEVKEVARRRTAGPMMTPDTSYSTCQFTAMCRIGREIFCDLQWLKHAWDGRKLSSNLSLSGAVWAQFSHFLICLGSMDTNSLSHLFGQLCAHSVQFYHLFWKHIPNFSLVSDLRFHLPVRHAHSTFGFSPVWSTWVQFLQTIATCVWQFTHTLVCVYKVNAGTPIFTRVYGTIIHICLTVCSCIARKALTRVCIQMVLAHAAMLTGVGPTLIDVLFTLFAWKQNKASLCQSPGQ